MAIQKVTHRYGLARLDVNKVHLDCQRDSRLSICNVLPNHFSKNMIRSLRDFRRKDASALGRVVRRLAGGEVSTLVQIGKGNPSACGAAGKAGCSTARQLSSTFLGDGALETEVFGAPLEESGVGGVNGTVGCDTIGSVDLNVHQGFDMLTEYGAGRKSGSCDNIQEANHIVRVRLVT
jgi:hypothetical protein